MNNINNSFMLELKGLLNYGYVKRAKSSVNDTPVKSVGERLLTINNPRQSFLSIPGRNINPYAIMGEIIWVLSGSNEIDNYYMGTLVPRAKDFSDDGKTWRGAYGPRLNVHNQLNDVVTRLSNDIDSRHGIVSIHTPSKDSNSGMRYFYDIENGNTKDMICNTTLYFATTPTENNGRALNITVCNRSNDLFWGLFNVNIPEFSAILMLIHDLINQRLKEQGKEGLSLGKVKVFTNDLHVYSELPVIKSQINNLISGAENIGILRDREFDKMPVNIPFINTEDLVGVNIEIVQEVCTEFMKEFKDHEDRIHKKQDILSSYMLLEIFMKYYKDLLYTDDGKVTILGQYMVMVAMYFMFDNETINTPIGLEYYRKIVEKYGIEDYFLFLGMNNKFLTLPKIK